MSNEKPPADLIKVYFIKNCLPLNVTFLILRFLCIDMNVVCWLFCFLFQQMTQHDINFVAEFLRDNFNHFTLVRIMWSFVNGSDDFMCLIHVKRICKSKTFLWCVKGDMYIILWFTENVMLWNLLFAIQTICQLWKYLEPLPILTFCWKRDFLKTFIGPT